MSKSTIINQVEKFLKKESETPNHSEDKVNKLKTVLKHLVEDNCFAIVDNECTVKCVFEGDIFEKELQRRKVKLENLGDQTCIILKSHFDVLFSLDINNNHLLKVVLFVEEFELQGQYIYNKEVPQNINLLPQIQALLRDVHSAYSLRKALEGKFFENDKISAANFFSKKFEAQAQNIFSLRVEGNNFLLRQKSYVPNFYSYTCDEKPTTSEILKVMESTDFKKFLLKHNNFKDSKVKELKPTKVDLKSIPSGSFEEENVDEDYRKYVTQTTMTNPISLLDKETYLKQKRRKTNVPKPTKCPQNITNLYNDYQNVFANIKLSNLNKYLNMMKYKESLSGK